MVFRFILTIAGDLLGLEKGKKEKMAKILILETTQGHPVSEVPEDLEYSSCVAKEIAPALRDLGHEVIEILKPTPDDAINAIETHNPDVIWHCGHGQVCITTLEDTERWMTHKSGSYSACTVDQYLQYAPNRFFSMLSCLAGSELGPQLINKGATAFMGYYESFWFLLCEDAPCPCGRGLSDSEEIRGIKCPAQCDLEWLHALAKGKTVKEAYDSSQTKFQSEIEYWEGSSHDMAADILYCLRLDKVRQVSLGNEGAKIAALDIPIPPFLPVEEYVKCIFPRIFTGNFTPRITTSDPIPRIRCILKKGGV